MTLLKRMILALEFLLALSGASRAGEHDYSGAYNHPNVSVVAVEAPEPPQLSGVASSDLRIPSNFQIIFGDVRTDDVTIKKTAANTITVSGNLQCTGTTCGGSSLSFAGVPTGVCTAKQNAVDTTTGDYYSCVGGTWLKVGPGAAGSLASPIVTPNPLNLDIDLHFKGPTPWVDVTRYGVRSATAGVAPQSLGITASVNSGTATVTLSSASTFQNGDGVMIVGAGATNTLSTPSAPTVTPSTSTAGTGIPGFVTNSPAGATAYNYKVVARPKGGGLTATSAAGSTATGQATLGANTVGITSLSRSGNTVTVVTSSAHGLAVNDSVNIFNTTDDPEFGGWQTVATVADNTHFTYTNGISTVVGGGASATGGTVRWFNANKVTWPAVTNAWQYYIYSDRVTPGTYALICISLPNGSSVSALLECDDYGSPMMDNIKAPLQVPLTNPSASATNDSLVTTIVSGAGTTTLTVANNAINTVSSKTILFDNAPNIIAAATAAGGQMAMFPLGTYVVNSLIDFTSFGSTGGTPLVLNGNLYLNDTLAMRGGQKIFGDMLIQTGALPSFAFLGSPTITTNGAYPGVFYNTSNSTSIRGVGFTQTANGGLSLLQDDGNQLELDNVAFSTVGTSSDYMGVGLMYRSVNHGSSANVFGVHWDRTLFAAAQGQVSATPLFIADGVGSMWLKETQLSGRGLGWIQGLFSGAFVSMDWLYTQATNHPLITYATTTNNASGLFDLKHVIQDTMNHPLLAQLGPQPGNLSVRLEGPFIGNGGAGVFSGLPLYSIFADNASTTGQNFNITNVGAGITSTAIGTGNNQRAGFSISGTLQVGYRMPTPAAPSVALGGAGSCVSNCVAAGTYVYATIANDVNGGSTLISPVSASVTTDGTKTITPSWTTLNGQVSTNTCRGPAANNMGCVYTIGTGAAGTSYIDSSAFFYSVSPPTSASAFSEGLSAKGFSGHAVTLSPVPFASLGAPQDGTLYFCPDCTIANPCAGGGSGGLAKRLNGVWVCN